MECNFHLSDGIYFRRDGDRITVVKAKDFQDPGEVLCATDVNGLASIASSMSPHREQNHSFQFMYDFLAKGIMYCGGCGKQLTVMAPGGGYLSIINMHSCMQCYETKFKPLFDWGLQRK